MKKHSAILFVVLIASLSFAGNSSAAQLTAAVSNESVSFNANYNLVGSLDLDLGYSQNFENSNSLADVGLSLGMGLGPVSTRAGVRAFYTMVDDKNSKGFAPGIGFGIKLMPSVSLNTSYYYSNEDFSDDNDFKYYRDWSATINFKPVSATNFYVGYGKTVVKLKDANEQTTKDGVIAGVVVNF